MYNNTQLRIIEQVYLKRDIHKRELARKLKLGMPSIDYALKKVDYLLNKKEVGNQLHFSLDYSNEKLVPFLCMVEAKRFNDLPRDIRGSVANFLIDLKNKPLIAIIFGSYAKGNHTKDSDIDLLLVFQKVNEKEIENSAKKISLAFNTKIAPVYLDYEDFRESYHKDNKEFFLKLKENKIILNGVNWWREIENEA